MNIDTEPPLVDRLPAHLSGDVMLGYPGGTSGRVALADLVAAGLVPDPDPAATAEHREARRARDSWELQACTCIEYCREDPASACSLHGRPHTHPDDGSGVFGPCPVHPDRPGDH